MDERIMMHKIPSYEGYFEVTPRVSEDVCEKWRKIEIRSYVEGNVRGVPAGPCGWSLEDSEGWADTILWDEEDTGFWNPVAWLAYMIDNLLPEGTEVYGEVSVWCPHKGNGKIVASGTAIIEEWDCEL